MSVGLPKFLSWDYLLPQKEHCDFIIVFILIKMSAAAIYYVKLCGVDCSIILEKHTIAL